MKFALKITTKLAVFYRLLLGEVCPEISHEIPAKWADFSANLSLKIPRNLTFFPRPIRSPAERSTFFRLRVYERVWISLVEVYERIGESVISVCKKNPKGLTDAFYGCKNVKKNVLVLWILKYFITV